MSPESYTRKLTAIFSADVAGYIRLMGDDEAETVNTLTAYDLFERHTKEDNIKARELLDQALKLEPNYANALALKAVTHFQDARFEYSASPAESFMSAVELCRKALTLDDTDPDTLALWGIIEMAQGQHEEAIGTGERALTLGPSNAEVHAMLGVKYYYAGRYQDAIRG